MAFMGNLNIGKKIGFVFTIVLAVAIAICAIGLWQMNRITASTRELMALPLTKERLVGDWYRMVYGGSRRLLAIAKSSDSSLVEFFAEDAAKATREVGVMLKKIEPLLTSPEEASFSSTSSRPATSTTATRSTSPRRKRRTMPRPPTGS